MPTFREKIADAKREAKRFLDRVKAWEEVNGSSSAISTYGWGSPMENGAVKRASMDLTRSLAKLRKSNW